MTNAFLLESEDGSLLVDAPEGALAWLESREFKPAALFLTHQHFDHCYDAAAIGEAFELPILAHSRFDPRSTLAELFTMFHGLSIDVEPFEVDEILGAGRDSVEILGREFGLLHVPGHSEDSLCLHDREDGRLYAGDTLMEGSMGRTDLPGGSQRLLVEGIREKILRLSPETVVCPGHGGLTSVGAERANPFLM